MGTVRSRSNLRSVGWNAPGLADFTSAPGFARADFRGDGDNFRSEASALTRGVPARGEASA